MEEKGELEKVDDVMLPGFRFHPTDEELVGFYLKRKIQQRPLPIELIKPVDIYKYDPWDLPKLATTGEKEWYFYCPRDRKYRNSARPNRVTAAGFWKATGTDRPIYSSDGIKCVGLKKSLVFYRGRAAKGIKTDWMMHEFRLPSITDAGPPKKILDRNIPLNESWAICRIFKKTSSMAQRAVSHSWVSSLPENMASDMLGLGPPHCSQFSSENNISCTTEIDDIQNASAVNFSALDLQPYRPSYLQISKPSDFPTSNGEIPNGSLVFSPLELLGPPSKGVMATDAQNPSSVILCPSSLGEVNKNSGGVNFEGQHHFSGFSINNSNNQWAATVSTRPMGFPFSVPSMAWDLDSPSCPSEMSTSFSTNKCYT